MLLSKKKKNGDSAPAELAVLASLPYSPSISSLGSLAYGFLLIYNQQMTFFLNFFYWFEELLRQIFLQFFSQIFHILKIFFNTILRIFFYLICVNSLRRSLILNFLRLQSSTGQCHAWFSGCFLAFKWFSNICRRLTLSSTLNQQTTHVLVPSLFSGT